jgi:hypothetical protein
MTTFIGEYTENCDQVNCFDLTMNPNRNINAIRMSCSMRQDNSKERDDLHRLSIDARIGLTQNPLRMQKRGGTKHCTKVAGNAFSNGSSTPATW